MRGKQSKPTRILLQGFGVAALLAALLSWTTLACRSAESGSATNVPKTSSASRAETPAEGLPASSDAPAADALELIEVQVIDRANDKPVANAELVYRARPHDYNFKYWDSWLTSREFDMHQGHAGEKVTADADGKARVPRPEFHAIVTARAGELWGYEVFRDDSDLPWRIEVERDVNLSARVVDTRGQPVAGARVVLRKRGCERPMDSMLVESGESDGLAVLPYSRYILRRNDDRRAELSIAVSGVFEQPVEVALDTANLPKEPVELVVPPGGECEVVVVGLDGEPTADEFEVTLRQLTSDEIADGATLQADPRAVPIKSVRGRVLFPHVVPGVELFATASRSGIVSHHSARGPGPAAIGQRATLAVRLGATLAVLHGRALDGDGSPLKKARLRARIENDKATWFSGDGDRGVESDEEGRFRVDVQPRTLEHTSFALVLVENDQRGGELRFATRPLPAHLPPGVYDLGDFALEPVPVLASGRVVDGNDAPVHNASISASIQRIQRVYPEYKEELVWQRFTNAFAVSDADGRFVLRGRVQAETLALSAHGSKGATGDPVLVAHGATDVVLQTRALGAIAGRILLDPSLNAAVLVVLQTSGTSWQPQPLGDDGSFVLRELLPDVYTVKLFLAGASTLLHTVEGIRIDSGGTTRDPRLDPLDLRSSFAGTKLTIVDADGRPVPHGTLQVTRPPADGERRPSRARFENGKALVMHDGSGVDLVVSSPGFRDVRLEKVREHRTVTLRGAPRVKLVLVGGQRPPEKPFGLGVQLEPAGFDASREDSMHEAVYFDAQGRLSVSAPDAGRMQLWFKLSYKPDDDNKWSDTYVTPKEAVFIDVRDVEAEQVFEVTCDATALSEAIEWLRKGKR